MVKEIRLSLTHVILIDESDFDLISKYKWRLHKIGHIFYASCTTTINKKQRIFYMHRLIMNVIDKKVLVDHKDRNGLNNQKSNLRLASKSDNGKNKSSHKGSTSNFLGVYFCNTYKKWVAEITVRNNITNKNHRFHLGRHTSETQAAKAYDEAAIKYHGEFANVNFK